MSKGAIPTPRKFCQNVSDNPATPYIAMNHTRPRLALVATLVGFAAPLSAQTLLNDNFNDGTRLPNPQALPDDGRWYLRSTGSTSLSAATGALVFTQNATPFTANVVTYFTDSGTRTIADGETLSVNFSMSVSNLTDTAIALQLGLFNSGGSRVGSDSTTSFQDAAFNAYTGYSTAFSTGATETNYRIGERTGASTAIFAAAATTQLNANPNDVAIGATANTPYSVSFSISRSGTEYTITSVINGVLATATDSSISASAFDTFALQFATSAVAGGGTITIDNVNIAVSAVPEPSSFAALAGLGAIAAFGLRRRR